MSFRTLYLFYNVNENIECILFIEKQIQKEIILSAYCII